MYWKKQNRPLVIFFCFVPLVWFFFFLFEVSIMFITYFHVRSRMSVTELRAWVVGWKITWQWGSRVCLDCSAALSPYAYPFFIVISTAHASVSLACELKSPPFAKPDQSQLPVKYVPEFLLAVIRPSSVIASCRDLTANLKGFVLPHPPDTNCFIRLCFVRFDLSWPNEQR